MTTPLSMDNALYLGIRENVSFYYFGSGCMVDYLSLPISYICESDLALIKMCDGSKTIGEIVQNLSVQQETVRNELYDKICLLLERGVLVKRSLPFQAAFQLHGVKGMYFPREIAIELTNSCNYRCPFCYKSAESEGAYISDEIIRSVDTVIHGNVSSILLTGGEPTLHPHVLEYLELFSQYAEVYMISNGSRFFCLDPKRLQKLKLIQFSIYGRNDAEYLKMTGAANGFSNLCRSIEFSKKIGLETQAAVTLCDATIKHFEDFVKIAIDLGIPFLIAGIADSFGRGEYLYKDDSLFEKEQDEDLNAILQIKKKYRSQIRIELQNINVSHFSPRQEVVSCIYRGALQCGCGSQYLVVSPSGKIRPCQMLPEEWFSIQSPTALEEHVQGNFHVPQLRQSVYNYYVDHHLLNSSFSPCHALDKMIHEEETLQWGTSPLFPSGGNSAR